MVSVGAAQAALPLVMRVAELPAYGRRLQAAERLTQEGISAEVIDPRSLVPFDWDMVKASVMKTTRTVVVEEGPRRGGWSAEIAATIAETCSDYLTAPVERVASPIVFDHLGHIPQPEGVSHPLYAKVRALTRRRIAVPLEELIHALNPVIRGWGMYFRRANVRRLFNRLNMWIVRRIWGWRFKRWRNAGWRS